MFVLCVNNSLRAKVRIFCLCAKDKHMSDVWLFTLFLYRAPIYSEGVALGKAVGIAAICPDKGNAIIVAHSVGKHYALVVVIGRAGVVESHLGSLHEALCHLQERSRLEDEQASARYLVLEQAADSHAAYLLTQLHGLLVTEGFFRVRTDRCQRGVGIEHPVFCHALCNIR